jgi:hypothetical protein
MNYKAEYYDKGEWVVCKPLNKDCETIVEDLVDSAGVTQNWSEEKKQQYFHRAISMACDMATRKPTSMLKKTIVNFRDRLVCVVYTFFIYVRQFFHS